MAKQRSDRQFDLGGPELTDTINFFKKHIMGVGGMGGNTGACEVRRVDKTFIFKLPLVKVLYVISHCRISPRPEGETKMQRQSNGFLDHYKKYVRNTTAYPSLCEKSDF